MQNRISEVIKIQTSVWGVDCVYTVSTIAGDSEVVTEGEVELIREFFALENMVWNIECERKSN